MMCIIKKKLWIAFLVFPFSVSYAQQKEFFNLNEILQHIDSNNVLLKTYGYRATAYQYSAEAATAWMPPMVGVGTFMTPYPFQKTMGNNGDIMFRVEQQFPNMKKLNAKKKYLESLGTVENMNRSISFNDLRAEARLQYFTWVIALQKIKVLEDNDRILQTMKKIEAVRFPFNQSQLSSVYRAEAEIQKNRNMILMPQGDIEKAKAFLNGMMNRPGNEDFTIDTTVQLSMMPDMAFDTASIAQQRGDILKMDAGIQSMKLNIDAMNLERKPAFSIQFDHMTPLSGMMPYSFSVMGMMTIPIASWSRKSYQSEIKSMQYNISAMESERTAMLQQTQGMLYGMHAQIMTMEQKIKSIEEKVIPALQKTFDASFNSYQENKLSLTVVLDNWEALNMMKQDVLDEKLKVIQMIIQHEKELYQ
ncbi:MAG: TolC family protein [Chitinophagaceae bacterium]|nr:TolC family protein [Chitinophagaceae bacterium]